MFQIYRSEDVMKTNRSYRILFMTMALALVLGVSGRISAQCSSNAAGTKGSKIYSIPVSKTTVVFQNAEDFTATILAPCSGNRIRYLL